MHWATGAGETEYHAKIEQFIIHPVGYKFMLKSDFKISTVYSLNFVAFSSDWS